MTGSCLCPTTTVGCGRSRRMGALPTTAEHRRRQESRVLQRPPDSSRRQGGAVHAGVRQCGHRGRRGRGRDRAGEPRSKNPDTRSQPPATFRPATSCMCTQARCWQSHSTSRPSQSPAILFRWSKGSARPGAAIPPTPFPTTGLSCTRPTQVCLRAASLFSPIARETSGRCSRSAAITSEFSISPDGRTLASRVFAVNDDIWTYDTASGARFQAHLRAARRDLPAVDGQQRTSPMAPARAPSSGSPRTARGPDKNSLAVRSQYGHWFLSRRQADGVCRSASVAAAGSSG